MKIFVIVPVVAGIAFASKGFMAENPWLLLVAGLLYATAWRIFSVFARNNENEAIAESLAQRGIRDVRIFRPRWGFTGSRKGYYVKGHFFPDDDYHEPTKDNYQLSVTIDIDRSVST